jgi:hypothetical protein
LSLGSRRQAVGYHRFEHLRRGDDRFARENGFGDESFLQDRHFLDRHFYPKVATRHHNAVSRVQDFIEAHDGV